jgi:hypothetical protein
VSKVSILALEAHIASSSVSAGRCFPGCKADHSTPSSAEVKND